MKHEIKCQVEIPDEFVFNNSPIQCCSRCKLYQSENCKIANILRRNPSLRFKLMDSEFRIKPNTKRVGKFKQLQCTLYFNFESIRIQDEKPFDIDING